MRLLAQTVNIELSDNKKAFNGRNFWKKTLAPQKKDIEPRRIPARRPSRAPAFDAPMRPLLLLRPRHTRARLPRPPQLSASPRPFLPWFYLFVTVIPLFSLSIKSWIRSPFDVNIQPETLSSFLHQHIRLPIILNWFLIIPELIKICLCQNPARHIQKYITDRLLKYLLYHLWLNIISGKS